jgi:hypothetical protein
MHPCPSDLHTSCDHRSGRSKWANVVYVWHAVHIVRMSLIPGHCAPGDSTVESGIIADWRRLAAPLVPWDCDRLSNSERVGT